MDPVDAEVNAAVDENEDVEEDVREVEGAGAEGGEEAVGPNVQEPEIQVDGAVGGDGVVVNEPLIPVRNASLSPNPPRYNEPQPQQANDMPEDHQQPLRPNLVVPEYVLADTEDEEAGQGNEDEQRGNQQQQVVIQQPPQVIQPPPSLLLRRPSISSLDESSQKFENLVQFNARLKPAPVYRNPIHASRCLEGLNGLRESGLVTDVTLVADKVEVRAHKNILAACSPYFYAMFTEPHFEEAKRDRIEIRGVDPEALETLIDYVYTSKVQVAENNVQSLLTASNLLQLTDVRDACCDFLQSQLHPSNCLGIRAFADLHSCHELKGVSEEYIESYFFEVLDSDEFSQLRHDQVIALISSDTITVPSEEKVYESVISWVNIDPAERRQHLPELLANVRLPLLSRDYLIRNVQNDPTIKAGPPQCKDLIIEALVFHLSVGGGGGAVGDSQESSVLENVRTKPRQPVGLPKVMLAIGGQAPKAIRSMECYDIKEERWFTMSDMELRRCRCGVVVVRGKIYAVGGFNGSLRVRNVDEYDPATDRWTSMPPMEHRRSTLGVAVLNDKIYAVGGFDGCTGLATAEVLDLSPLSKGLLENAQGQNPTSPNRSQWQPIANMSTRRSSVGVGVLNGRVYAVGGYDGNSRHCLSTVEAYDPEMGTWSNVAEMSARRSGAGVGVLNGFLFAIGGHDGPLVRRSVECYDPTANRWTSAAEMNFCRRNAGVAAHGGLIYVVGGDDGSSNLNSVEVYNPKTDSWTVLRATLNTGRSYTGVCIIDKPDNL